MIGAVKKNELHQVIKTAESDLVVNSHVDVYVEETAERDLQNRLKRQEILNAMKRG